MVKIKENRGFIFIFILTVIIGFTFQWWGPFFDGGDGVLSTAVKNISSFLGEDEIAVVEGGWLGLSMGIALLITSCIGVAAYCKHRNQQRDYEEIRDPGSIGERVKRLIFNIGAIYGATQLNNNDSSDDNNNLSNSEYSVKTVYWIDKSSGEKRKFIAENPSFFKEIHKKFVQYNWKDSSPDTKSYKTRLSIYVRSLKSDLYLKLFMNQDEWLNILESPSYILDAFDASSKKNNYVKEFCFFMNLIDINNFKKEVSPDVTNRIIYLFSLYEFFNESNRELLSKKENASKFQVLIIWNFFYNLAGEFIPAFLRAISENPEMLYHVITQYAANLSCFIDKLLLIIQKELSQPNKSNLTQVFIDPMAKTSTEKLSFFTNVVHRISFHKKMKNNMFNDLFELITVSNKIKSHTLNINPTNSFIFQKSKNPSESTPLVSQKEEEDKKGKGKLKDPEQTTFTT